MLLHQYLTKLIIGISIGISLFGTTSSLNLQPINADSNKASMRESKPVIPKITQDQYEQNINGVKNTNPSDIMNKISHKQSFILFVGFRECKYCRAFSPELHQFITKDHANVNYLNLDNLTSNQMTPNFTKFINKDLQLDGTPTIALIQNGNVNQDLNYSGYGFNLSDLEAMLNFHN